VERQRLLERCRVIDERRARPVYHNTSAHQRHPFVGHAERQPGVLLNEDER
jgi:hypothetical protein